MLARGDSLNCSKCLQHFKNSVDEQQKHPKKKLTRPKCWEGTHCHNAWAQFESVEIWVGFFFRLRNSEVIRSGALGRDLLQWAEALDPETVEALCYIEAMWSEVEAEQREREGK